MGRPAGSPDRELVERARGGDGSAFAELVRRHERRAYNVAYRMLGSAEDARDATQDAFLSCFRLLHSFRGEAAFTTWLHRIVVNACYDVLRKRTRDPLPVEELPEPRAASDEADRSASALDVQRALAALPPDYRAVLVLHDIQGFAYEEIASVLEVPLGTVKSRLHRGRVALGRALSGEHSGVSMRRNPD